MGDENEYRYKYNGIEEVDDFGLDLSFATYRTLDPAIGRWLQVDPYAESFASLNPYNSMGNNPISFTDPDGDFITWSAGNGGFSIGVNFGIGGGGITFGGGSFGVYGEVGPRIGGTGFGGGATISQSLNFSSNGITTTTTAGLHGSIGILNVGANVGATFDLSNGTYAGTSWGVNAGLGVGNEKGGVGLSFGYGSSGLNYGIGGYYDPRVKLNDTYRVLTANDDGTYSDHLDQKDFLEGQSINSGDYATSLQGNPNVTEVDNGDGTFTYTLNVPRRHKINGAQSPSDVIVLSSSSSKNQFTVTTLGRSGSMTFLSSRPYSGDYFNFKNFNVRETNDNRRYKIWHLNLFGRR